METLRLTGPDAGSVKYDLLTALVVTGLNGPPLLQTSLARLAALITARYNWRLDEVSIGQRDLARMWGVNERTVKREMKRLIDRRILICKRAGVRGRVGAYRLNYPEIVAISEPVWPLVGPDYEDRMKQKFKKPSSNVVPLRVIAENTAKELPSDTSPWMQAMQTLSSEKPDLYGAWFARLSFEEYSQNVVTLQSPNAFISRYIETHFLALLSEVLEPVYGEISQIVFKYPVA